jgi:hypothetical protein
MRAVIFLGPTLALEEAREVLDATYLPPASQGDVFRAVATSDADVVGIIDGNFSEVPAVWHKELLWAMSQGVRVIGAASMGALRAAELADFGMIGEGRVFAAYRSGVLAPYEAPFEDDDEVAVVHAPAELGHRPLSDALVDIRCTVARAAQEGVISAALRDRLVQLGKARFYPERSYDALIADAERAGWPPDELQRLRDWLPVGGVSQKKQDALALLARIRAGDFTGRTQATFDFHHTTMWDCLTAEAMAQAPPGGATLLTRDEQAVLAELRLQPDDFTRLKEQAERTLRIGCCPPVGRLTRAMLEALREEGGYPALAARAAHKAAALRDVEAPRGVSGLQALQLLDWYFGRRLGREMPDDVEEFWQFLGYGARNEFLDALLQEYAYVNSEACVETSRGGGSGALERMGLEG